MIINSHLVIADYVYNYIKSEKGYKLHKKKFKYGNIKPDLNKQPGLSHNFVSSIKYVIERINLIRNESLSVEDMSLILGEINHFITDYFCAYHSYIHLIKRNIIAHIIYETFLHFKLKQLNLSNRFLKKTSKKIEEIIPEDIQDILLSFQKSYRSNKISISNDIKFALLATTTITDCLINEYMKNNYAYTKAA